MKFLVKGSFKKGKDSRLFSKEVEAEKEHSASEKVKSLFGSKNSIKRHQIKIDSVTKM